MSWALSYIPLITHKFYHRKVPKTKTKNQNRNKKNY